VVNSDGSVTERSSRYLNVDLRVAKSIPLRGRALIKGYLDFYNLFDTENLYFGSNGRLGLSAATATGQFMQASSLYGPGFGPPVGRPLTVVLGARAEF
jgi:hypothetical protein